MIQSTIRQLWITWHYLWDVTKRRTRIVFQEMGKYPEYVAISDTWAGGGCQRKDLSPWGTLDDATERKVQT